MDRNVVGRSIGSHRSNLHCSIIMGLANLNLAAIIAVTMLLEIDCNGGHHLAVYFVTTAFIFLQ